MRYIILFLFFTLSIYAKERIVVLDFVHPKNVSREMAVSSYNYFVSELNRIEQFDIIEKSQLKAVLKEIEFQQSGCTDTICEIKIGQMLYADKIASGNIIRKGKKYIININIRNVKDNSLEFAETIDLYDENKLEVSMNLLRKRLYRGNQMDLSDTRDTTLTSEEMELVERNHKLEKDSEFNRDILNRTILFPGWGHFYLDKTRGIIYFSLYAVSFVNWITLYGYRDVKMIGGTKKEIHDNRAIYFYENQATNPELNQPVIAYSLFDLGNSIIERKYNQVGSRRLINFGITLAIMMIAAFDIQYFKKEKELQAFSFTVRPETSYSGKSSFSQGRAGNYFEFSYSMRF